MYERRRYNRIPIKLTLAIDKLFKQDNEQIRDLNFEIQVVNVSKTGIGFVCEKEIPLNYYFNARIDLEDKEFFHTVIKIIRKEPLLDEGITLYGCEFVGLAQFLANKVDKYEKKLNMGGLE